MNPTPDQIDELRLAYRLAKTAEDTRNRLSAGVTAFLRTYVSGWTPDADKAERKKTAAAAKRVVKQALRDARPVDGRGKPVCPWPEVLTKVDPLEPGDFAIMNATTMVRELPPAWWRFELERHKHRRRAEKIAETFPACPRLAHINGCTLWTLCTLVGEFGDLTDNLVPENEREPGQRYSGVRRIYKRLGLAPDDCYPQGERRTGRKIPRATRGRIMGIIGESLLRQQWRGDKNGEDGASHRAHESQTASDRPVISGHPIGPFGEVYYQVKLRKLAEGLEKGHADRLARRAMVKALIHDVHRAWNDLPLTYAMLPEAA